MASMLPDVPGNLPDEVYEYLDLVKQSIDQSFDGINRDLSKITDAITPAPAVDALPIGLQQEASPYYGVPPKLVNVEAGGAIHHIVITWASPNYNNHSHVEVWRSDTNNRENAERIGESISNVFSDEVDPGTTFYYWVRSITKANVAGPYQGNEGVQGSTEQDSTHIINVLSQKTGGYCVDSHGLILHDYDDLGESRCVSDGHSWMPTNIVRLPFRVVEMGYCVDRDGNERSEYQTEQTCEASDHSWVEPGVYMDSAWIIKASITTAHIGQLYADDIDVDELSAFTANLGDVTAGTLKGPRGNFQLDLWAGQLNVYDESGALRVRLGEIGEVESQTFKDAVAYLNENDVRPPDSGGTSVMSNDVIQYILSNNITQIECWGYLVASGNGNQFIDWAGDAAGLCMLMRTSTGWSC